MNLIKVLAKQLNERYPEAAIVISEPAENNGYWWLDILMPARHLVVEWRPQQGFALSTRLKHKTPVYGDEADNVYPEDTHKIFNKVTSVLDSDPLPV